MKLTIAVCAIFAAILIFAFWVDSKMEKEWAAFSAAHECKVIGKSSATTSVGYGMTPNGQFGTVITTSPGKTGYMCNDGVTYWR